MDLNTDDQSANSLGITRRTSSRPSPLIFIQDDEAPDKEQESPSEASSACSINVQDYVINKEPARCAPVLGVLLVCDPKSASTLRSSKSETCLYSPTKRVHFADACGLDLTAVKQIDTNSVDDLLIPPFAANKPDNSDDVSDKYVFKVLFEQPGCSWEFSSALRRQRILLENCFVDDKSFVLKAVVMVLREMSPMKIFARHTVDAWKNQEDIACVLIEDNYDENEIDYRYSFDIDLKKYLLKESVLPSDAVCAVCDNSNIYNLNSSVFVLEFAICLELNGQSYWDNNNSMNYKIECCQIVS